MTTIAEAHLSLSRHSAPPPLEVHCVTPAEKWNWSVERQQDGNNLRFNNFGCYEYSKFEKHSFIEVCLHFRC